MDFSFLECPVCSEVFEDVLETPCCHKCYCKECINAWVNKSSNCPECRGDLSLDQLKPNIPLQRIINNLPSVCPNHKEGCNEAVTKGILLDHQKICPYQRVKCFYSDRCGSFLKKDVEHHQNTECPCAPDKCENCGAVLLRRELQQSHNENECPYQPASCNLCSNIVLRKDLVEHQETRCLEASVDCTFACHGCKERPTRKLLDEHLNEATPSHLKLVLVSLEQRESENKALIGKLHKVEKELQSYVENSVKIRAVADREVNFKPSHLVTNHPQIISLENNGREASHLGNWRFLQKNIPAYMARGDVIIPKTNEIFYFEIRVLQPGKTGAIGIGLVNEKHNLEGMPGWSAGSFGYHGDDGRVFTVDVGGKGSEFGPTWTKDDIVGLGWSTKDGSVFFTKNGVHLGIAFYVSPDTSYYPAIGFHTPGAKVKVNFGQEEFIYKLENKN